MLSTCTPALDGLADSNDKEKSLYGSTWKYKEEKSTMDSGGVHTTSKKETASALEIAKQVQKKQPNMSKHQEKSKWAENISHEGL